jgi:CheY-like chemotaxis protein
MLRIVIAEDHTAVRRAIRSILDSDPECQVVGEATNGREAVEQAGRLKPDVVLLDVVMPTLNGLEAMREILRLPSAPQVLILTTHQSEALSRDAIRSGAGGIVAKSGAHELLIPALESLVERKRGVHLAGSVLRENHVALFSPSKGEVYALLDPFVVEGLRQGHKVVYLMDHEDRDDLMRRLGEQGLDVRSAGARGQIELIPWRELSLPDSSIEYLTVCGFWEKVVRNAAAEGFARARIIGYMDWALHMRDGPTCLEDFEARMDHALQGLDDIGTCAYDLSKFESSVIEGVARRHPGVVVNGHLEPSRSYVPPAATPG